MFKSVILGLSTENIDQIAGVHFIPEVFYTCLVMLLMCIFAFITFFVFKKAMKNPLKTPNGFVLFMTFLVEKIENLTVEIMGERNRKLSGYFLALMPLIFILFIFGLTGLSSPMTYFGVPLCFSTVTFLMIHGTAMKENKWGYFKRYVDPFPVFLPVNLISMWAPLLSLALRMFGNALSGYCIMGLIYAALEAVSADIFRPIFGLVNSSGLTGADIIIAPIVTPVLHLYFDLFSGAIQTLVFTMLTMIFVANEQNEDSAEEILDKVQFEGK